MSVAIIGSLLGQKAKGDILGLVFGKVSPLFELEIRPKKVKKARGNILGPPNQKVNSIVTFPTKVQPL
uniref:Uncharacterized protein n=1 Tax=Moniliophthora roreri TaxID=221103 RepID=A0A0W0GFU1_MONRR